MKLGTRVTLLDFRTCRVGLRHVVQSAINIGGELGESGEYILSFKK